MALFRDEKEALRRLDAALQEEESQEAENEEEEEQEAEMPAAPRRSRKKATVYLLIALLEVALVCGLLAYGAKLLFG